MRVHLCANYRKKADLKKWLVLDLGLQVPKVAKRKKALLLKTCQNTQVRFDSRTSSKTGRQPFYPKSLESLLQRARKIISFAERA